MNKGEKIRREKMAANDEALQALQVALECWAKFSLDARRSTLDSQAARIAEAQDAALKSRRELTEQTKVRCLLMRGSYR